MTNQHKLVKSLSCSLLSVTYYNRIELFCYSCSTRIGVLRVYQTQCAKKNKRNQRSKKNIVNS